jgi:hypothetical protein
MNMADELLNLHHLHQSGALTDDEFAAAKAKLLAAGNDQSVANADPRMEQQLEELRIQSALTRLDQEWDRDREQYMMYGRYGYRYLPNKAMSVLGGVVIVVFGLFWTIMAGAITVGVGGGPPFPFNLFPLFGMLFIAFGVGVSIYSFVKASKYEEAQRRYQNRRARLLGLPFEDEDRARGLDNEGYFR